MSCSRRLASRTPQHANTCTLSAINHTFIGLLRLDTLPSGPWKLGLDHQVRCLLIYVGLFIFDRTDGGGQERRRGEKSIQVKV